MTFYPWMFVLLDIERTLSGLTSWPPSAASQTLVNDAEGFRRRSLYELSNTLQADLAWMHDVPERVRSWRDIRTVCAPINETPLEKRNIALGFDSQFRHVIPRPQRASRVLGLITFDGDNHVQMLATADPTHDAILGFLRAVQPVHAFVTSEWTHPAHDLPNDPGMHNYFRQAPRHVFDSTFLGPELTRLIPPALLGPDAGFSHVKRVGEGTWITFAGVGLRSGEMHEEEGFFERHRDACAQIEAFLQAFPSGAIP